MSDMLLFLEQALSEVAEGTAPGEPLVGCALGNIGHAVDALLLNGCTAGWEAEVAFITTPADVEQAHLLVEGGWVGKGTAKDGLHVLIGLV